MLGGYRVAKATLICIAFQLIGLAIAFIGSITIKLHCVNMYPKLSEEFHRHPLHYDVSTKHARVGECVLASGFFFDLVHLWQPERFQFSSLQKAIIEYQGPGRTSRRVVLVLSDRSIPLYPYYSKGLGVDHEKTASEINSLIDQMNANQLMDFVWEEEWSLFIILVGGLSILIGWVYCIATCLQHVTLEDKND